MGNKGLEFQLFDWDEWEEVDVGDLLYYPVTLKVKIGQFDIGEKLDNALLRMSDSKLVLQKDEKEYTFDLLLSVK